MFSDTQAMIVIDASDKHNEEKQQAIDGSNIDTV